MKSLGRKVLICKKTLFFFFCVANYFDLPGMKHLVSVHLPIIKYFEMGRHSFLCLSETLWYHCSYRVQNLSLHFACEPFSLIGAEIVATAWTDLISKSLKGQDCLECYWITELQKCICHTVIRDEAMQMQLTDLWKKVEMLPIINRNTIQMILNIYQSW